MNFRMPRQFFDESFHFGKHSIQWNCVNVYVCMCKGETNRTEYEITIVAKVAMTNTLSSVEMSFKNIISVQCTEDSNLLNVKRIEKEREREQKKNNQWLSFSRAEVSRMPPISVCHSLRSGRTNIFFSRYFTIVVVVHCNRVFFFSYSVDSLLLFFFWCCYCCLSLFAHSHFGLFNFKLPLRQLLLLFFCWAWDIRVKYFAQLSVSLHITSLLFFFSLCVVFIFAVLVAKFSSVFGMYATLYMFQQK